MFYGQQIVGHCLIEIYAVTSPFFIQKIKIFHNVIVSSVTEHCNPVGLGLGHFHIICHQVKVQQKFDKSILRGPTN